MHPVKLSDGEVELIKRAREERDWTILPTFKLKYLYQRLVAFPSSDISAVKDIASLARKHKSKDNYYQTVKENLL